MKSFRARTRVLRGCKSHSMKQYMANVWYHADRDHSDEIHSRLVTEEELSEILLGRGHFHDIVSIQLYIGGWPLKGSGVFEHKLTAKLGGGFNHETFELGCLPLDSQEITLNTFCKEVPRFKVVEGHHETISYFASRLTRILENSAHSKLSSITYEINFNSALTPIFICAHTISLNRIPEVKSAKKIFTAIRGRRNSVLSESALGFTDNPNAAISSPTATKDSKHHHDQHQGGHPEHHHEHLPPSSPHTEYKHRHHDGSRPNSPTTAHRNSSHDITFAETLHVISDTVRQPESTLIIPSSTNYDSFAEYDLTRGGGELNLIEYSISCFL